MEQGQIAEFVRKSQLFDFIVQFGRCALVLADNAHFAGFHQLQRERVLHHLGGRRAVQVVERQHEESDKEIVGWQIYG